MDDDTPLFRQLIQEAVGERRPAAGLVEAVHADHDRRHEGPIMFCDASVCRVAWEAVDLVVA